MSGKRKNPPVSWARDIEKVVEWKQQLLMIETLTQLWGKTPKQQPVSSPTTSSLQGWYFTIYRLKNFENRNIEAITTSWKPLIISKNRKTRMESKRKYRDAWHKFWKNVLSIDETKIYLFESYGTVKVWRMIQRIRSNPWSMVGGWWMCLGLGLHGCFRYRTVYYELMK